MGSRWSLTHYVPAAAQLNSSSGLGLVPGGPGGLLLRAPGARSWWGSSCPEDRVRHDGPESLFVPGGGVAPALLSGLPAAPSTGDPLRQVHPLSCRPDMDGIGKSCGLRAQAQLLSSCGAQAHWPL